MYVFARADRDSDWFQVRVIQQAPPLHGYLHISVLALPLEMLPMDSGEPRPPGATTG